MANLIQSIKENHLILILFYFKIQVAYCFYYTFDADRPAQSFVPYPLIIKILPLFGLLESAFFVYIIIEIFFIQNDTKTLSLTYVLVLGAPAIVSEDTSMVFTSLPDPKKSHTFLNVLIVSRK